MKRELVIGISPCLPHPLVLLVPPVYSVVFSPDGKTLASASVDDTIKFWNMSLDDLLAQVAVG